MGEDVILIDSAVETSLEIKSILEVLGLNSGPEAIPFNKFYVTDSTERFLKVGENFLGQKIEQIEKIVVGG